MNCPRPPCCLSEIPKLILELYELRVTVVEELESYSDRNILVNVDDHGSPRCPQDENCISQQRKRLLVKITNQIDSARPEQSDMKNAMIVHLNKAGFPTPGPLLNLQGRYQCLVELGNADTKKPVKHILRLFEFVPGKTIRAIRLTSCLCRELGKLGGWLDEILKKFPVQDYEGIERLGSEWSMTQVPNLRSKLRFVTDKDKFPLIEEVISSFEIQVLKSQKLFSKGLIHADLNDCNILATDRVVNDKRRPEILSSSTEGDYTVSSIIDFGDCSYSMYLWEVAVAMCYAMINKDGLDHMEAAGSVLSGYLEHVTLSTHELSHLHISICARLVQSFVNSQVSKAKDESHEYSQIYSKKAWWMLQTLWELSGDQFLQQVGSATL